MTFWGLGDWPGGTAGLWSFPRSATPLLGEYNSADPTVAESQISTATRYGVNIFYLDFGWIQPGDELDRATQSGLLKAKNIDQVDLCIFYFTDAVVGQDWSQGPDRLRSDFDYLAKTYFAHPSYLRVDGRPVVIVNNLPVYWNALGATKTNALFAEVKKKNDLYLIGGVWPDSETKALKGSPFDALTVWGNLWGSLGDDPDGTYTYAEYAAAYKRILGSWHDYAVSHHVQFVPLVMPGFDNLAYVPLGQDHKIIKRDLAGFTSLMRYAGTLMTSPLKMLLLFTWNDFGEGTAIEPSDKFGDTYLKAITSSIHR